MSGSPATGSMVRTSWPRSRYTCRSRDHCLLFLERECRLQGADVKAFFGTVVNHARLAYDDRLMPSGTLGAARLAVLADALERSGCTDAELLGHLRGPGPHVRGCWAVDLLLGRE